MEDEKDYNKRPNFLLTPKEFFHDLVKDGVRKKNIKPIPQVINYLVNLLVNFVKADQLYKEDENGKRSKETLAEIYLRALNTEKGKEKIELFKKLGDTSLYISGFFGDSLSRKIVDLDYYIAMGEIAYKNLGVFVTNNLSRNVYKNMSYHFPIYVDVLTYVSQKSMIQNNRNLLRLYERYIKTGSELARDQLIEQGILPISSNSSTKKMTKQ